MIRFAQICVSAALALSTLWAQTDANKGQIVGTVYDPNQAAVPGAAVRVKNIDTSFTRSVSSNDTGQYRAVLLDPGRYELSVEKSGFAPATLTGIVVSVGSSVAVDVNLQVGTTVQTIEVSEAMVSITMPSPQAFVNNLAITNLPINGRRFQDFALLTPGIQVDTQRGQLAFLGQRGINSNVMVDGSDYNNPFFGGIRGGERSNSIFTVPQSSVQEFQVVSNGYTAEYGRSTGGVLNAITKGGTNEFHGDAFFLTRREEFGMENPFKKKILENQSQIGGSAGGPAIRDRMFWFAAVERQDASTPRQVLFGALASVTRNAANAEAYDYFKSLEKPFDSTNDGTAVTGRTDYQFANGSRLSLRYNFSDASAENAASTGDAITATTNFAVSANGLEQDRTHTGVAQLTSIFGPSIANDLRFSTSIEIRPRDANSRSPYVTSTIGNFGARNFLPTTQDDRRIQINDGMSVAAGRHTLKFGVDYNHVKAAQLFGFNQFGSFSFRTSNVAQLLDILSLGGTVANRFDDPLVSFNRQIGNLQAEMAIHQFALYAQDNWRVSPKLTLDFGLRWEGQWNPSPEANNTNVINAVKNGDFGNGLKVDPTIIRDATKQVMPRFGFAYNPFTSNRTVIRGHAGLFYASTPLLLMAGAVNNFRIPPGDVSIFLPRSGSTVYKDFLAVGVDLNKTPLNQLPVLSIEQVQRAAAGAGGAVDPFRNASVTTNALDYLNPRAFQAGLGMDQQLTENWAAGVQFNYINTVHLQRNRDYNLPAPTIRASDRSGREYFSRSPRPAASLNQIAVRETNARSMYRGMTLSTQYRRSRFQFAAFYTLSEAFSDDDNERSAGGFSYSNPFDLRREYGYSELDYRHQFTANSVYSLPLGLEVSGIFRTYSGRPVDPRAGSDLNNDGSNTDRALKSPGVLFERNSFRNRGIANVDMRILKSFKLWNETSKVQFSCEFFNLFNADNVVYGGSNLTYGPGVDTNGNVVAPNANFRRLKLANGDYDPVNRQVGTPFQMQLGVRFFF